MTGSCSTQTMFDRKTVCSISHSANILPSISTNTAFTAVVPISIPKKATEYKMEYIDATCPLVSKVHKEAENLYKNNYHILLIGHQNHPEVIGTMGQLPNEAIDLIESINDVNNHE